MSSEITELDKVRIELAMARLMAEHWRARADMWKTAYEKLQVQLMLSGGVAEEPLHTEN